MDELLQNIKESEVKVEMDTSSSSLGDIINNIRVHYQKLSEQNLQETEDWYKNKVWTGTPVSLCLCVSHCCPSTLSPPSLRTWRWRRPRTTRLWTLETLS